MTLTQFEALAERELEKERRLGVEHFKPGQLAVRRSGAGTATNGEHIYELSLVDGMGHAWLIFCVFAGEDSGWSIVTALTAGQTRIREARVKPELRASWVRELDAVRTAEVKA